MKVSEITKLPRYGTVVYVREVERCTKYIYALNEPVVSERDRRLALRMYARGR